MYFLYFDFIFYVPFAFSGSKKYQIEQMLTDWFFYEIEIQIRTF